MKLTLVIILFFVVDLMWYCYCYFSWATQVLHLFYLCKIDVIDCDCLHWCQVKNRDHYLESYHIILFEIQNEEKTLTWSNIYLLKFLVDSISYRAFISYGSFVWTCDGLFCFRFRFVWNRWGHAQWSWIVSQSGKWMERKRGCVRESKVKRICGDQSERCCLLWLYLKCNAQSISIDFIFYFLYMFIIMCWRKDKN